jgi:DNA-binding MarR family transcriptional regulator
MMIIDRATTTGIYDGESHNGAGHMPFGRAKGMHLAELSKLNAHYAAARRSGSVPFQSLPILGSLVLNPGATPGELCAALNFDADSMSRALRVLRQEYGVIHFAPDRDDTRRKRFYLTKKGREEIVTWLSEVGVELGKEEINEIPIIVRASRPTHAA